MSGGVDSTVSAVLMQQQGYHVIGITMLQMDPCAKQEAIRRDAIHVCSQLGIDLYLIDARIDFKRTVVDHFIGEYLSGRTPNPCVHCNRSIKWGVLMRHAFAKGADFFATGHYARIKYDSASKRYQLTKARDPDKDQSYALWQLDQEQLARTLFPLGDLSKEEVRRIAADLNLDAAERPESQEICFVPDDDYQSFLSTFVETIEPGEIIDENDRVIGRHRGYPFYTIGQRRGLGLALGYPVYVTEILPASNRIRIGKRSSLLAAGLVAGQLNWISLATPQPGQKITVRIRYNDPGYPATIKELGDDRITILFDRPRSAVTPGQSAVFFDNDTVLGGGIIAHAVGKSRGSADKP